jgi:hypothetical protein
VGISHVFCKEPGAQVSVLWFCRESLGVSVLCGESLWSRVFALCGVSNAESGGVSDVHLLRVSPGFHGNMVWALHWAEATPKILAISVCNLSAL